MFRVLALTAFALAAPLFAQLKDPPKVETKLKVGDSAPPLAVTKWLVGKEVKAFEKDTVYVASFTNLSPPFALAVVGMDELAKAHAGKGLVVVGVHTMHGKKPSAQDVEEHVWLGTKFAEELGVSYPVAYDADKKNWDAYVGEARSVTAFVIDKAGKVAYAGPDAVAAYVAEKVLAGTWKGKADVDAVNGAMDDLIKFMNGVFVRDPDEKDDDQKRMKKLQAELPAFEKRFKDAPFLLATSYGQQGRLMIHAMAQSYDVPDEILTARIATATKRKSVLLLKDLSYMFGGSPKSPDPKVAKLVAKYTDAYAGLLDMKEVVTIEYARTQWYDLIVMSTKYGNTAEAERYTKMLLDAVSQKNRKGVEEEIQKQLKAAGVGK